MISTCLTTKLTLLESVLREVTAIVRLPNPKLSTVVWLSNPELNTVVWLPNWKPSAVVQCVTNIRIFSAEYLIFEYEYWIFVSRIYSNIRKNLTNIFEYFELSFTFLALDKCTKDIRFLWHVDNFWKELWYGSNWCYFCGLTRYFSCLIYTLIQIVWI